MADQAHQQTDDEIARLEKQIAGVYNRAYKSTAKAWSDYLESISPELDEAYKKYQDAIKSGEGIQKAKDVYSNKLREYTFNNQEYRDVVKRTTKSITATNVAALAIVNAAMVKVYANNYNQSVRKAEKALQNKSIGIGISFDLVDQSTVRRLAKTKDIILPYKKLDPEKDTKWNAKAINSQLMQGLLQGESLPEISKRLQNVTDMDDASAIRNARTMCTSAENAGRQDHMAQMDEAGVHVKKQWMATLDEHTRAWHADLDGVSIEQDESFTNEYGEIMYPGDPDADPANVYNCRCTLVEDYSELTGNSDFSRRDNEDRSVVENMTYWDWHAAKYGDED